MPGTLAVYLYLNLYLYLYVYLYQLAGRTVKRVPSTIDLHLYLYVYLYQFARENRQECAMYAGSVFVFVFELVFGCVICMCICTN